jgi:hypothetical protein
MKCNKCGQECPEGSVFCTNCGNSLTAQAQPNQQQTYGSQAQANQQQTYGAQPQQQYSAPQYNAQQYSTSAYGQGLNPDNIPPEYKPISMWGYFGYELLFSIPCVGFILLIVFSVGGTKNINLRNFARSYFCFLIVLAVLAIIITAIAGGVGAAAYYSYR